MRLYKLLLNLGAPDLIRGLHQQQAEVPDQVRDV